MRRARMRIAQLNDEQLAKLQVFEEELGAYVVALEPQYKLAHLTAEEIAQIEAMEQELGVVLLAYGRE